MDCVCKGVKKMNKEQLKEAIEGHVVRADDCMMNQNVIPLEVIKVLIDQLEEPEITYEKALNKLAEHLPMTSNQVSDHLGNLVAAGGNCTYGIIKELSKLEKYKEQELKITGLTNMDLEELTAKLVTGEWGKFEFPESVELPKFVADMIKRGNECNEKLSETFRKIYGPRFWGASPYEKAAKWARENPYEFARAWSDGYVIEKEPKWIVKLGKIYFVEGALTPKFDFYKSSAKKYDKKSDAKYVAESFGGEVEEVEVEE